MKRTKAIEILDAAKVPYELAQFEAVDFSAEEAAKKLGLPLDCVFKTLVTRGEKCGVIMALLPGNKELSLKKLAHVLGEKKMEMVQVDELMRLTGYLKGGCSPLGGKKKYPIYIDHSVVQKPRISISAGQRGLQILIDPRNLIAAAEAEISDLCD